MHAVVVLLGGVLREQCPISAWAEQCSKSYIWCNIVYVELPLLWICMCENRNV